MIEPFTRDYSYGGGFRRIYYKVNGFWPFDKLCVSQSKALDDKWRSVDMSWSSGGRIGEIDEITAAESFIIALQDAVAVAKAWELERKEELL